MMEKPIGPKTSEEAAALPELSMMVIPDIKQIQGDEIILFRDKDGIVKDVVFYKGEYWKQENSVL